MTSFQEVYDVLPRYEMDQAKAGVELKSTGGTLFKALSHVAHQGHRINELCIVIPSRDADSLDGQQGRIYENEWGDKYPHWTAPLKEYAANFHAQLKKEYASNYNNQLENTIKVSAELSSSERLQKIKDYPDIPEKITINTVGFKRNPHIIAERLYLAQGICGNCTNPAPFNKKNSGQPYLEVHHVKPLSEGGKDILKNTIALCPNCHRKRHFG